MVLMQFVELQRPAAFYRLERGFTKKSKVQGGKLAKARLGTIRGDLLGFGHERRGRGSDLRGMDVCLVVR